MKTPMQIVHCMSREIAFKDSRMPVKHFCLEALILCAFLPACVYATPTWSARTYVQRKKTPSVVGKKAVLCYKDFALSLSVRTDKHLMCK